MSNTIVQTLEEVFQRARVLDAPLDARLGMIRQAVEDLAPDFAAAVDRLINRLKANGAGSTAPQVGDLMPPFLLPDEDGHLVSLDELLDKGPVAVAFHRGHWCPYCRLNASAWAEIDAEVAACGGRLVAILPEGSRYTNMLKQDARTQFSLLTDIDNGYALSLDLAIWVNQEMSDMIAAAGWNIPAYQGNDSWILPIPATFVIGQDGIVRARYVDPDYRFRMPLEDILEALRSSD